MIKSTVRKLRKETTIAEATLWQYLRDRNLDGKKFVRQYPVQFVHLRRRRFVVVDFYCHALKLAIEVDGSVHKGREEIDRYREEVLADMGIRVIRFSNEEVLGSIDSVLHAITPKCVPLPPLSFKRGARGELKGNP